MTSGLPTAATLTWEFKRAIYCNENGLPPARFADLTNLSFQQLVQSYLESAGGHPIVGDASEYSHYFETYLPSENDRRLYIRNRLSDARPSYGHMCLAALLAIKKAEAVWTTNFDKLVERAVSSEEFKTQLADGLNTISLECTEKLSDAVRSNEWPVLVKLHGDYQFRRLKNTAEELQEQDRELHKWLRELGGRKGLAIVGYSGRDASVMESLQSVLTLGDPFPHGIFWLVQRGTSPSSNALSLLAAAKAHGCEAGFVEIGGFDEAMHAVLNSVRSEDDDLLARIQNLGRRRDAAPIRHDGRNWPVVRTNAIEIVEYPATCTIFQANVGGARELREITQAGGKTICTGRIQQGILAFGSKGDIEETFLSRDARDFDTFQIDRSRLFRQDSVQAGMFYETLCQSLSQRTGLKRTPIRKGRVLYAQTSDIFSTEQLRTLSQLAIKPTRVAANGTARIHEAVEIGLDFRDNRLWLLLSPTLYVTEIDGSIYNGADRFDIGRNELTSRFNNKMNSILVFWLDFISSKCGSPCELHYPTESIASAKFKLNPVSGFSRCL